MLRAGVLGSLEIRGEVQEKADLDRREVDQFQEVPITEVHGHDGALL